MSNKVTNSFTSKFTKSISTKNCWKEFYSTVPNSSEIQKIDFSNYQDISEEDFRKSKNRFDTFEGPSFTLKYNTFNDCIYIICLNKIFKFDKLVVFKVDLINDNISMNNNNMRISEFKNLVDVSFNKNSLEIVFYDDIVAKGKSEWERFEVDCENIDLVKRNKQLTKIEGYERQLYPTKHSPYLILADGQNMHSKHFNLIKIEHQIE